MKSNTTPVLSAEEIYKAKSERLFNFFIQPYIKDSTRLSIELNIAQLLKDLDKEFAASQSPQVTDRHVNDKVIWWCDNTIKCCKEHPAYPDEVLNAVVAQFESMKENFERAQVTEPAQRLRPEVLWFAGKMEEKMKANDHKGGWRNDTPASLLNRLDQETAELWAEVKHSIPDYKKIVREAADVANFAMMVADQYREEELSTPHPSQEISQLSGEEVIEPKSCNAMGLCLSCKQTMDEDEGRWGFCFDCYQES